MLIHGRGVCMSVAHSQENTVNKEFTGREINRAELCTKGSRNGWPFRTAWVVPPLNSHLSYFACSTFKWLEWAPACIKLRLTCVRHFSPPLLFKGPHDEQFVGPTLWECAFSKLTLLYSGIQSQINRDYRNRHERKKAHATHTLSEVSGWHSLNTAFG